LTGSRHQSFSRTARTLSRRLGQSNLFHHIRGVVLVPPSRGRSVLYASAGNEAFLERLKDHSDFCRDTHLGGALHPGSTSFREVKRTPSLHISLEGHDRLAVHLDRSGPAVDRGSDGGCIYERSRAARHLWDDILPSLSWTWSTSDRTGRQRKSLPSGGPPPVLAAGSSADRPSFLHRVAALEPQFDRRRYVAAWGDPQPHSPLTPQARPPPALVSPQGEEAM
jgi:hypothetical protein